MAKRAGDYKILLIVAAILAAALGYLVLFRGSEYNEKLVPKNPPKSIYIPFMQMPKKGQ